MRAIVLLCLSLLILPNMAHAFAFKGKEKVILDATNRAILETYDKNFRKAAMECEKVRSVAGSDKFLLGVLEMCFGEVESAQGAAHVQATCKHYSRAITLWQLAPPPHNGDGELAKRHRGWIQILNSYRKSKHCI